jgi:hypothetical protein|nr:MAG TPA: hypothetical protein [Caudoviricetes sp.]
MTIKELKSNIKTLGFEDDSTMDLYSEIVLNAINRSIDWVYRTVVEPYKNYFEDVVEVDVYEPSHITSDTSEMEEIDLPDMVCGIVPLMSAYFIWLDDDERKATMYWNNADDLKTQLLSAIIKPRKCKFVGGLEI